MQISISKLFEKQYHKRQLLILFRMLPIVFWTIFKTWLADSIVKFASPHFLSKKMKNGKRPILRQMYAKKTTINPHRLTTIAEKWLPNYIHVLNTRGSLHTRLLNERDWSPHVRPTFSRTSISSLIRQRRTGWSAVPRESRAPLEH